MNYRTEWRKTWLKVSITTERKASDGKNICYKLECYVFSTPNGLAPLLCITGWRLISGEDKTREF